MSGFYTIHVAVGYDATLDTVAVGRWPLRPRCGADFSHRKGDVWFRGKGGDLEVILGRAAHPCTECFSEGLELYLLAAV